MFVFGSFFVKFGATRGGCAAAVAVRGCYKQRGVVAYGQ